MCCSGRTWAPGSPRRSPSPNRTVSIGTFMLTTSPSRAQIRRVVVKREGSCSGERSAREAQCDQSARRNQRLGLTSLAPDCHGLLIQGVNPSCECICDFALMANESVGCTLEHLRLDGGGSGSVAANHIEVGGR